MKKLERFLSNIRFFKENRIFYTSKIIQDGTGYYQRQYKHIFLDIESKTFAGYNLKALNSDETTFSQHINLLNLNDNTKSQSFNDQNW